MIMPAGKERTAIVTALLLTAGLMSSCGAGTNSGTGGMTAGAHPQSMADSSVASVSSTGSAASEINSAGRNYSVTDEEDLVRLQHLWNARTTQNIDNNYPIGPGDVLEINAQYVEELKAKTVRVAGDGSIDLPLLGTIQAAGLSEVALSAEIAGKLRKYIYKPEVEVFVRSYQSHQVAVTGAVKNAGPITLSDSKETILDMLKKAGGTTADAGDAVIFFPGGDGNGAGGDGNSAGQGGSSILLETAEVARKHTTSDGHHNPQNSGHGRTAAPQDLEPVIIPLRSTSLTPNRRYTMSPPGTENFLRMPVRPGDLILVPGGGEVMVMGWVRAPGRFRVSPGLTALEAIAAAGGPLYAGDQSNVRLIRADPSGTKRIIQINVSAIRKGNAEDPAIFPNDIVDVPVSKVKLAPYVFYTLLTRTGLGVATGGVGMGVGGVGMVR
jgi:protein involved in polysaccharide export with SLBB domain